MAKRGDPDQTHAGSDQGDSGDAGGWQHQSLRRLLVWHRSPDAGKLDVERTEVGTRLCCIYASARQAELRAEAVLVANIRKASKKSSQAAAWILERRSQMDWASHVKELREVVWILKRVAEDRKQKELVEAASYRASAFANDHD